MISVDEFLHCPLPRDNAVWLHALEVVEHCLQGDVFQTKWQDTGPSKRMFESWRKDMLQRTEWDGDFNQIQENTFVPCKTWAREDADMGDFNVDLHLDNLTNLNAPRFDLYSKLLKGKPAVTIIMSINVNYYQREDKFMVQRQHKAYKVAAQCESERRPCRVIAVDNSEIPEVKGDTLKMFYVIKDYMDPIFPAIWGTFVDNKSTNDFGNVSADYLTGTHASGNGRCVPLKGLRRFFPEDEELIIYGSNDLKE